MRLPRVAVIVLNWNNFPDTRDCIESLENIDYNNYEVIIVDNDSKDGSAEQLKEYFPGFRIVFNKENTGYTGGNNLGIKIALRENADYILILNNDTIIESISILSNMVFYMEKYKSIGILGPKIMSYSDNKVLTNYFDSFWWANIKKLCIKKETIYPYGGKVSTRLLGSALLIRKEVFNIVGFLDEDFFMYSEEDDFSLRVILKGMDNVYYPNETVFRKVDGETPNYTIRRNYYCTRNKIHMLKKNFKKGPLLYMNAINLIGEIRKICHLFLKGDFKLLIIIFRGLVAGYRGELGKRNSIK